MRTSKTFCKWTHNRIQINAYGDISQCCFQPKPLGNIFKTTLEEVWKSETIQDIRKQSEKNLMHPQCKIWDACPFIKDRPRVLSDTSWSEEGPMELEICLPNTHCNIGGEKPTKDNKACIMCPRNFPFHGEPDRTLEIAQLVKHHMPRLEMLFIGGVAEPFWKGLIFKILDVMNFDAHSHQCQLQTVTNGTLLTEANTDEFLRRAPQFRMCASMDAATPETFEKIRRLKTFDKVVNNLKAFCRKTKANQIVEIHNNINMLNIRELPQMVRLTDDIGADLIGVNITHNPGFGSKNIKALDHLLLNPSNSHVFEEYYQKAQKEASRLGVNLTAYKKFKAEPEGLYQIKVI